MSNQIPIKEFCRNLRKNQTEAEKILWAALRNRKLDKLKFLRQHPFVYKNENGRIYFFIGDFYCAEKKLVIELDGKIHGYQKDYDENRDQIIKSMGIRVVRFSNDETTMLPALLKKILEAAAV